MVYFDIASKGVYPNTSGVVVVALYERRAKVCRGVITGVNGIIVRSRGVITISGTHNVLV